MKIHDWNPDKGDACQGDVLLFRIPDSITLDLSAEIKPNDNRLVLAEGEVTGHHHAIFLRNAPVMFREDGSGGGLSFLKLPTPEEVFQAASPQLRAAYTKHEQRVRASDVDDYLRPGPGVASLVRAMVRADEAIQEQTSDRVDVGAAKLYRDPAAIRALVDAKELRDERLAIGVLVVEGAPVALRHDEHDAIRIPPGRYYVGGQQEWDAAEARRVQD